MMFYFIGSQPEYGKSQGVQIFITLCRVFYDNVIIAKQLTRGTRAFFFSAWRHASRNKLGTAALLV